MIEKNSLLWFLIVSVGLFILCKKSSIAKWYVKMILIVIPISIYGFLVLALMLLKPFDPSNILIPARIFRIHFWLLGVRWQIRGLEHLDKEKGMVVVLNHQTCLDTLVLTIILPHLGRAKAIAKRLVILFFPYGPALWLAGTIFIDRGAESARATFNKVAETLKPEKTKLVLFPEGTRNSNEKFLPFRKGAFHVAVRGGVPIQPIITSKHYFFSGDHRRFDSGEIIITVLPPIETTGMTKEDIPRLMEMTREKMHEAYKSSTAEIMEKNKNEKEVH